MANISLLLNQIKNAKFGKDVRKAIHDAILQCYRDAIKANNPNAEIADARGTHDSLRERFEALEQNKGSFDIKKITSNIVSISIQNNTHYECENDINTFSLQIGDEITPNFKSYIVFETGDIEEIKVEKDNIIFSGEHCSSGELTLVKNTLYYIEISYLKSDWLIGKVLCYSEGDSGTTTDPGENDNTETVELHDFYGADEMLEIAMSYYRVRSSYMIYKSTKNILSDNSAYDWNTVTVAGADADDGRYRGLDCSAFVGLCLRGITFSEVFLNETTYNNRDLSARTNIYDWATIVPRTAADICKYVEEQNWTIKDGSYKKGDLVFWKGTTSNGRYKDVNHVAIYYGENSEGNECVIEFTSSSTVKKHSDGITCGIQIIQFAKKDASRIVCVARPQTGSPKAA